VDVLIVGGGGGSGATISNPNAGWYTESGGGAGAQVLSLSDMYLSSGTQTIVVAAGGVGQVVNEGIYCPPGGKSWIGATAMYSADGGGMGGSYTYKSGPGFNTGGAGGHDYTGNALGSVATPISPLGYTGGAKVAQYSAGGGAGAGGNGNNSSASLGGLGGLPASSYITGSLIYYASGGTGGSNVSAPAPTNGGGGAGGVYAKGSNGASNTGGGGGGGFAQSTSSTSGSNGGSGIVIIRVPRPKTSNPSTVIASGGNNIQTYVASGADGINGQTYKYHTFTSSGTLTVTQAGFVDVVVVGGGGGAVINLILDQAVAALEVS
jgi:hypothetical protein